MHSTPVQPWCAVMWQVTAPASGLSACGRHGTGLGSCVPRLLSSTDTSRGAGPRLRGAAGDCGRGCPGHPHCLVHSRLRPGCGPLLCPVCLSAWAAPCTTGCSPTAAGCAQRGTAVQGQGASSMQHSHQPASAVPAAAGHVWENTLDTLLMLARSPALAAVNAAFVACVVGLNVCGLLVTRSLGSVFRAVLMTTRTASVSPPMSDSVPGLLGCEAAGPGAQGTPSPAVGRGAPLHAARACQAPTAAGPHLPVRAGVGVRPAAAPLCRGRRPHRRALGGAVRVGVAGWFCAAPAGHAAVRPGTALACCGHAEAKLHSFRQTC